MEEQQYLEGTFTIVPEEILNDIDKAQVEYDTFIHEQRFKIQQYRNKDSIEIKKNTTNMTYLKVEIKADISYSQYIARQFRDEPMKTEVNLISRSKFSGKVKITEWDNFFENIKEYLEKDDTEPETNDFYECEYEDVQEEDIKELPAGRKALTSGEDNIIPMEEIKRGE